MLAEIYLLLMAFGFICWIASAFNDMLLLAWIPVLIFLLLGITSFNIEYQYCDMNDTLSWGCHVESHIRQNEGWLFYALGFVALANAIYHSIKKPLEQIPKI